jgi:hypothetical protein
MNKLMKKLEDMLQLARLVDGKASPEKREEDHQEQYDKNFTDEPVCPGMGCVVAEMNGVKKGVGGRCQGAIKESGDPEFWFHQCEERLTKKFCNSSKIVEVKTAAVLVRSPRITAKALTPNVLTIA